MLLRTPEVTEEVEALQPRQCGVGVPFAAEIAGMGLQRVSDYVTIPWVTLQVDVRNAFDCVDRSAMLEGALRTAPRVYSWLAWCYQKPSPLLCQGKELTASSAGVHQGDAMGPMGFALALNTALMTLQEEESRLPWCSWYLDDGTIVGSLPDVTLYLERLVPKLREIGLGVNLDKCRLWGPGIQVEGAPCDNIPDQTPLNHPIRKIPVVPYGESSGIKCLGVPCDAKNSVRFAVNTWDETVKGVQKV